MIIAFATGVLSKYVDIAEEHGFNAPRSLRGATGLLYGALIAYVISISPELSALWIATVIAVVVTGKIDTIDHFLGLGSMIFLLPVLGIAGLNVVHLVIFSVIGITDEVINDRIVDKNKLKGIFSDFLSIRPMLEITAFLVALLTSQWIIWLGILTYDIGYVLVDRIGSKN